MLFLLHDEMNKLHNYFFMGFLLTYKTIVVMVQVFLAM